MKKLNFGCGRDIKEGWDNIDIQKSPKITKSFDFDKFPYPLKENMYDYVFLSNILEHSDKPDKVLDEIWRITKKKGIIKIIVPHYTNKGAYSDLQHRHFFNEICFKNLITQEDNINKKNKFELIKLELVPTIVGKFIFISQLREKLSLFINGLISTINVELKVIK